MLKQLDAGSYFGTSSDVHHGEGLSVVETTYPAGFDIPPHEHANPFFCFVLGGLGTRSWPGRPGVEGPMALTLFPAELPHANHWYGDGGRVMHVEFAEPWLERLRGTTRVLERPADFDRGPPLWLAHRLAAECRHRDDVSPLVIEGLVLELLAACSRSREVPDSGSPPVWFARARRLVQERFAAKLSLGAFAAECGVSADHLGRAFRRHHGCTVGAFVRRLRVDDACRRLAHSNAPLAEVALASGFADQSHFTKVFRAHMGVAPSRFRALHGGRRFST